MDPIKTIADELSVSANQVEAAVDLLDEGATVPFIARYRKEATAGLDDSQLRHLQERLIYLRELNERRESVIESIRSRGLLTPELERSIRSADSKTRLEDLYLPYKPKRRSKALLAREAGLEPLLDRLLENRRLDPKQAAQAFVDAVKGIPDEAAALDGAQYILMERIAEDAELVARLREKIWDEGVLHATVVDGKQQEGAKFSDYFDFSERLRRIPSHRALALFRGRSEGVLKLSLVVSADDEKGHAIFERMVAGHFRIGGSVQSADLWLRHVVHMAWKVKLFTRLDLDLKLRLRELAEQEAIRVFAGNMKDLLLAAPAGPRVTIGLDPGLRTGVKVAAVDATGKLLETATIYPHVPQRKWDQAIAVLAGLIERHNVDLISIGNGTGSRETDALVSDLMKRHPQRPLTKITVSEAGASVYSASELAANEFPDLDVSLRGAVSIARRLQDPLAELVKIEPKAIGVGQYQHDVNQTRLARALDAVVEDCVNAVGVDVNTASAALLEQVSGLTGSTARHIVDHRDEHGPFVNREQLKKVPRLGDKTFQLAAGFLRIMQGDQPLDASAVHPEAYSVVEWMSRKTGKRIDELVGQSDLLRRLRPGDFTDDRFGLPTVADILSELEKPGRDPRPEFKSVRFKEGVKEMTDLTAGMRMEGVITNVTNFGAFVDIGVHQDGLVHISELAESFVKDPRDVVKTGDLVPVKVLEVDVARSRISLSMRTGSAAAGEGGKRQKRGDRTKLPLPKRRTEETPQPRGAMADALARALDKS
jgi:protein Tex